MADYCVLDDVRGWLPNGQALDDKTKDQPSASTVSAWITDFSGLIDVHFAKAGVATPITNGDVLKLLKVRLAHELVYHVMTLRGGVEDSEKLALWTKWHAEFEALLKQIEAGDLGATAAASNAGSAWSYTQDSVHGVVSSDPSIDPKIDIGARY